MSVENSVAQLICDDVKSGNVLRLGEWAKERPDFIELMNSKLGFDALSYSIETHNWRMLRFMLDYRHSPIFANILDTAMESDFELCNKVVAANIQRNPARSMDVLRELTETWRWK